MSSMREDKDKNQVPTWNGEQALWPDCVRQCRLAYETCEKRKRKTLRTKASNDTDLESLGRDLQYRSWSPSKVQRCQVPSQPFARALGQDLHTGQWPKAWRVVHQVAPLSRRSLFDMGIKSDEGLQECEKSLGTSEEGYQTRCWDTQVES